MNNPYESFYHGLVTSKIWLCDELEKIIDEGVLTSPKLCILGGWHNLISFMLLVRRPYGYDSVMSYDKDSAATEVANMICDTWRIQEPMVKNITADVSTMNFRNVEKNTIFINCSVDQFSNTQWYDTIPVGTIVCMQTTDIVDENPPWEINQRTKDLSEFKIKYPMSEILYEGTKPIIYPTLKYNRLMIIGKK